MQSMSGYEGRTKGKRFRKPLSGSSNLRERWKYLCADTNDVVEGSTPRLKKPPRQSTASARHVRRERIGSEAGYASRMHQPPAGYDIDGDGQIDVREMRIAKFLDEMIQKRTAAGSTKEFSETDLQQMRQDAGRLLMAKEFIERNHGQLWRYGSVFAEKNEDQSAEFIAAHKKFPKLMAFLESSERQRVMRSSRHVRGTLKEDPYREDPSPFHRQTWVESVRKVNNALVSKFPLPDLQPKPKPKQSHSPVAVDNNDEHEGNDDVFTNEYGAIDVDGDGVVDFDEMKLHIRLKEATLDDPAMNVAGRNGPRELRKLQQLAGRRMMAGDFVTRNDGKMWLYDLKYKGQATEDVIEQIASSEQFGRDYNRLRAKERVLALKSSMGVAGCIAQMPAAELPNDPTNTLEFRRVRHRTELLMARKDLMKPPEQRIAVQLAKSGTIPGTIPSLPFGAVREEVQPTVTRSRSEGTLVGLPRIFETPRRIEPTGSFSVTKWKFGEQ